MHRHTQTHLVAAVTRKEPEPPANPFPSPQIPHSSPGQVDREEVLLQQALVHQVIKDWCDPISSQVGVSQAQDPIEFDVDKELARLSGAQAKELVGVHQRSHLGTVRCCEACSRHWDHGLNLVGKEQGIPCCRWRRSFRQR